MMKLKYGVDIDLTEKGKNKKFGTLVRKIIALFH